MLRAFRDEVEKIAEPSWKTEARARGFISKNSTAGHWAKEKKAGFMRDVGMNVGNTLKGFTRPVQATKKGWNEGGWSQGQEARTMLQQGKKVGKLGTKWSTGKGVGRFLPGNKAITLASSAAMIPSTFKKEDPSGQGKSRAERIGSLAGNTVGGLIGAPYGFSGSIAGSVIGDVGGRYLGKAVNKVTGKKKPKKAPAVAQREPELPEPAQARLTGPQVNP
jgi:phage tail tape-measure protein